MAAGPDDPLVTQSWKQRFGLRRRLRRAWRKGLADQHATSLSRLRTELSGHQVVSATYSGTIGDVTFANGVTVRLWLCHRPAVKVLRTAAREGDVTLIRADHHGHCWALYFDTLEGRLPLMCRDLRIRAEHGGVSGPADPRLPSPNDRTPTSV